MDKVHDFFNTTNNYLHRSFGVQIRAEIVRELVGHPTEKKILDLGCGNGGISIQFGKSNHITFVDLSENMISLVRDNLTRSEVRRSTMLVGSMFELEIKQEYDYVFGIGLLAHVPSVSSALKRMASFLKPDGVVVIQFSNYANWLTRYNVRNSGHYGYDINRLSYAAMKDLVAESGFSLENEVQFSLLFPGMGKLPNGFLYRYSKYVWKSKLLSRFATDYIWYLKKI